MVSPRLQNNPLFNLVLCFLINISLSASNKLVLQELATPWLLTFLHTSLTAVGCVLCLQNRYFSLSSDLTITQRVRVMAFSLLFTINIATSNVSLSHVTLAFHQVARSTSPIFTVAVYKVWYGKSYAWTVYLAVAAMSTGIALATYGDHSCTLSGGFLTFAGMALATVKGRSFKAELALMLTCEQTITTHRLMTDGKLKFHPIELLLRMCPLAAIQSLYCAHIGGEFAVLRKLIREGAFSERVSMLVIANGILAFVQNLTSFHTNKLTGALTMAICANVKQFCTIVLAMSIFKTRVSVCGALGILMVLSGTSLYSWTIATNNRGIADSVGKTALTQEISEEEKDFGH